jgi:hypothetical protein
MSFNLCAPQSVCQVLEKFHNLTVLAKLPSKYIIYKICQYLKTQSTAEFWKKMLTFAFDAIKRAIRLCDLRPAQVQIHLLASVITDLRFAFLGQKFSDPSFIPRRERGGGSSTRTTSCISPTVCLCLCGCGAHETISLVRCGVLKMERATAESPAHTAEKLQVAFLHLLLLAAKTTIC